MPLIFTDTQSSPPFRLPPVTSKPGMPSSPPFRLPPVTSTFSPPFRPPPVTSEPRMPFLFADTQSTTHIPRQGRIILPKSTKKRVSSVLKPPPSTELPPIGKAICPAIPPNSIVESSTPDKTSPPAYTMFPPLPQEIRIFLAAIHCRILVSVKKLYLAVIHLRIHVFVKKARQNPQDPFLILRLLRCWFAPQQQQQRPTPYSRFKSSNFNSPGAPGGPRITDRSDRFNQRLVPIASR
ncbi:hypothetical protein MJO29_016550 [Puccinia striiformis f. sp. tritici]|nr:hypothetical protein MJO29_016550 [Puccinia striiformis f. sp. tritici]